MDNAQPDRVRRQEYVDKIVGSTARHKVIVAGPGTGKTTAFKAVLASVPDGDRVALTFIRNLVRDLEKDLAGLAEAKTFHAYCRKLLHRRASEGLTTKFHYFPPLEELISADAKLLKVAPRLPSLDFAEALRTLAEGDGRIAFFLERSSFYNAVGFDDSVYRVLKSFQADTSTVPELTYLIVDEYQDFNALEVGFLGHLEDRAPTLIAGDDDQAIYQSLRNAHPSYIRDKHASSTHESFELPYCGRCTRVLVEATNYFVDRAQAHGLLKGRIPKQFLPFSGKDRDSAAFPKIVAAICKTDTAASPQIAEYIAHELAAIPQEIRDEASRSDGGFPLALILGPGQYLRRIHEALKDRVPDLQYAPRRDLTLDLLDGFRALLKDGRGNLGWRVLMDVLRHRQLGRDLRKAATTGKPLIEVLPDEFVRTQQEILELLRRGLEDGDAITAEEWTRLEDALRARRSGIEAALKSSNDRSAEESQPDRNGAIVMTSYSGAKGLSAGVVFVVGMEEGALPRHNDRPTDEEANQFIVALTRARKQCHLIHTGQFMGFKKRHSAFLTWLRKDMVETRQVDAAIIRSWRRG